MVLPNSGHFEADNDGSKNVLGKSEAEISDNTALDWKQRGTSDGREHGADSSEREWDKQKQAMS